MKKEQIVTEIINSLKDYLPRFIQGITNLVEYLRKNELDKAHEILVMIPEGLEWIYDAVRLTSDVFDFGGNINLAEISNSINEAIENKDYNLLADVLEYELLISCDKINKQIKSFSL